MPARRHVAIGASVVGAVVGDARAAAPRECCGLLIGTGDAVVRAHPAANLAEAATRYEVAPADHFAALRAARAEGLAVVGAYHSHPSGPAEPSATDRADAVPDFLYLIVGLGDEPPDIRLWTLVDGNFVQVDLVGTGGAGA